MPQRKSIDVIALTWDGPFSYEEIKTGRYIGHGRPAQDRGIYQIYGNHDQPNTLLYLGKTQSSFSDRIPAQSHWIEWVSYPEQIFLGKIVNLSPDDDYSTVLTRTELFMIYFCSPPINKHGKAAFESVSGAPETVIINYGKRFRLPYVISNLCEKEDIYSFAGGSTLEKSITEAGDDSLS